MMNFIAQGAEIIAQGANMIVKQKKQKPAEENQGWGNQGGQNQGGQNQGWGNQGGQKMEGQNAWGSPQQGQNGWGAPQQGQNNGWGAPEQGQNNGGWGSPQQGGYGAQQTGGNSWNEIAGWGDFGEASQQHWGNNVDGWQWVQQQKKRNEFEIINYNQSNGGNLQQFIEQQVVFIEPSPVQKKLEQLKKQGRTFTDEMFPPTESSLVGDYGSDPNWKSIKWAKISDVIKNPSIFQGKIQPGDIKQGYLGDCYFLAGLAALAQRPDRIFNLFLTRESNQQKFYSVKMLYKGKWMTIDMDEYAPFLGSQPAFSKASDNELWVVLLEKAWAKLYTSYKRIEAGYPEQPLHDLTGAPIKQIVVKSPSFNKETEWQYLIEASQRQYSMVASSNPGSDTNKSVSGVVQGHAYTVLCATTINFQGNQQRIVQLRNPWGKGEFKGRWSDNDPNWNYISPEDKQRLGYTKKEDGIFFMPYDDFIAEYRAITVAQIDDNASYIYKSVKDKQCKGAYFTVDILAQGIYSFHVDKTPQRIYPEKYQQKFQYPEAQLELGKMQGNQCQKLEGIRSAKRTLFKKYNLAPGKYVTFVKIAYNRDFEDEFDVNLAIYASTACTVKLATKEQAVIFSGNPSVQWSGVETQATQPWNTMGNVDHSSNKQPNNQGVWGEQPPQQQGWGNQQQQGWGGGQQGGQQGGWSSQQVPQQQGGWSSQQAPQQQGGWSSQQVPQQQGGWINQQAPQQQAPQQQGGQQQGGWGQNSGQQSQGWGNNNGW